jgi:hypothetical protein
MRLLYCTDFPEQYKNNSVLTGVESLLALKETKEEFFIFWREVKSPTCLLN